MSRRRLQASQRLASQALELALTAPQVAGHRIARMAAASVPASPRDQAEFARMGSEKVFAFYESWTAMWAAACTAHWQLAQTMTSSTLAAMRGKQVAFDPLWALQAATQLSTAGLAPVHRKARANAKRLARRRR